MNEKPNNRYSERLRRYAAAENKMLLRTEADEIADYLDAVTDMADDLKTIEMFMELGRQEKKLVRNVVASSWTPEEKKKTEASENTDDMVKVVRCGECNWSTDDGRRLLLCSMYRDPAGECRRVSRYNFCGLAQRKR